MVSAVQKPKTRKQDDAFALQLKATVISDRGEIKRCLKEAVKTLAEICVEPDVVLIEQFVKASKTEVINFLNGRVVTISEIPIDEDVIADEEFVAETDTPPEGMYV